MKTNYLKLLVIALVTICLHSCKFAEEKEGNYLKFEPVDLKEHLLPVKEAKIASELFKDDMDSLYRRIDELERMLEEKDQDPDQSSSNSKVNQNDNGEKSYKFKVALSNWYSTDELLTYIYNSKKTVESKGGKVDGFRIYVAVLPETDQIKPNTLTTFITPTGTPSRKGKEEANILPNFDAPLPYPPGSQDLQEVEPLDYGGHRDPPAPYGE
ncbi:hypothetical protein [Galbibacter mesophilus]|uniref:hypothetical protein n=1 Tax=Galbibacter mesophilus TaxID=379069 RepID=UPI00191DBC29|nr:hypothetical protein [Galbibacter mesophilus]MCM5662995.1 hypothetical protein [Galbibacter mesophilus]